MRGQLETTLIRCNDLPSGGFVVGGTEATITVVINTLFVCSAIIADLAHVYLSHCYTMGQIIKSVVVCLCTCMCL